MVFQLRSLGYLLILNFQANQNHTWRYTNTCASFASETFYDVTGIDIDADDWGGFETPREISSSISDINNGATVGGTQWWW